MKLHSNECRLSASLLAAAVFFWCGCTASEAPDFPLNRMVWHPLDAPETVRFELVDGSRAVGCCGDNRFFGPIELEGTAEAGRLKFGLLGVTLRKGPTQKYEKKFLETLRQVRYYVFGNGKLTLCDENCRVVMILSGESIPPAHD